MKKLRLLLAVALSVLAFSTVAHAAVVNGTVFCDANQNGIIDIGDPGISGMLVIITNENYSFSNSAVTAPDGSFSISIPNPTSTPQVFVETLDPASLPDGSTILLPLAVTNITTTPAYFISYLTTTNSTNLVFTSGAGNSSTGDWLIANPQCGSAGNCKVSGEGHITGTREVDHIFGGTIISGNPPSGRWTDNSRALKLAFKSTAIQTVTCGTGSIEFTGTGTLRSRNGHSDEVAVQFTAEIQNLSVGNGRKNKVVQSYFLDVFTADGTTLELVSTDLADPTDIAPVPIARGDLFIQSE